MGKAGDLAVVGFDSGQAQINAIKSGVMTGAITQDPIDIGYQTVKTAVEAVKGKERPRGHRHRLLLVRQVEPRRPADQVGAVPLVPRLGTTNSTPSRQTLVVERSGNR